MLVALVRPLSRGESHYSTSRVGVMLLDRLDGEDSYG